ncbi:MAG: DUF6188 family protein [Intrasporangium sp.]|uniref:DUF6188 family protein n=1 Tax=Intrasporangium sp. TaxID=1925024 RepID=UPI002648C4A3|nr:DUF6188 family protein [Intrasporangium sp.]MDN5798150.1 DUF6188 family protein [Intrasporangium sp.]
MRGGSSTSKGQPTSSVLGSNRRREEINVGIHVDDEDLPLEPRQLVDSQLRNVVVSPNGDLALNFSDAQVNVRADPKYESWQIHGARGEIVVCKPSGDLAVWGPWV